MKCESCTEQHDGSFGSGRFCSSKCARGFSTKAKRSEINEKVSKSLTGRARPEIRVSWEHKCASCGKTFEKYVRPNRKAYCTDCGGKSPNSILETSKRTVTKILKRLNIGCSICGWDKTVCDVHHIIHRKDGGSDDHENLTYVCPNCHREIHNNLILPVMNLVEQIGEDWKKYYG